MNAFPNFTKLIRKALGLPHPIPQPPIPQPHIQPPPPPGWQIYNDPFTAGAAKYGKAMKPTTGPQEEFYNKKLTSVISLRGARQKGGIGLEIEAEGKNLFNTPMKYWSCHEDGSLRPTDGQPPVEYVLKEPLGAKECEQALYWLVAKLKEAGSQVILSNRTSVHVHINCQDMTVRQLYCYILLYIIFEEALVEWSGPERSGNLFCLRAKDSDYIIQMLEQVLKEKSFRCWREELRYSACNISSINKFGSLEFRSLRGTIDPDLIMTWVGILVMLRKASLTYDNPVKIIEEFNQLGPQPFFKKIFKDEGYRRLVEHQPQLTAKLWSGLRMVRDVAYSCEWKAPLPKKVGEPEVEEEDKKIWCHGDTVQTIEGGYSVRTHYNDEGEPSVYHVRELLPDGSFGPHTTIVLMPHHTIYYARPDGIGGDWLFLDIREGHPE